MNREELKKKIEKWKELAGVFIIGTNTYVKSLFAFIRYDNSMDGLYPTLGGIIRARNILKDVLWFIRYDEAYNKGKTIVKEDLPYVSEEVQKAYIQVEGFIWYLYADKCHSTMINE